MWGRPPSRRTRDLRFADLAAAPPANRSCDRATVMRLRQRALGRRSSVVTCARCIEASSARDAPTDNAKIRPRDTWLCLPPFERTYDRAVAVMEGGWVAELFILRLSGSQASDCERVSTGAGYGPKSTSGRFGRAFARSWTLSRTVDHLINLTSPGFTSWINRLNLTM